MAESAEELAARVRDLRLRVGALEAGEKRLTHIAERMTELLEAVVDRFRVQAGLPTSEEEGDSESGDSDD